MEQEQAAARWRLLPKIEAFFSTSPSSSSAVREKGEACWGEVHSRTESGRGRGISLEMDRGGSVRRRLSSLSRAWRWSTGYLFRKVGALVDRPRMVAPTWCCSSARLAVCSGFFVMEGVLWSPSLTFTSRQHLPPSLLPSLLPSSTLSQMLNSNGLLVKSNSTAGFHLETGLLQA